ncbi:MAG: UDP-N-acetylglucosamine 2-epimerase (non-hydrolyzing) [Sphingobacteriaceae bacterium]|nr:UDP-N-acetylglucosamine 2-epimerase (non-hydrolyzing) [Sphingobacteriaceae bacterium]
MKILTVIGTRPNFIKVTRFKEVANTYPSIEIKIAHTGQHYDNNMADVFFEQFELVPDYFLKVNSGSPINQIAEILIKLEELILTQFKPDLILAVGDVNSTLAAALTANKMNIKLGHIESGLRSFDESMPEEHNRIVTDKLSNLFFVTEPSGILNLKNENIPSDKIHYVGNTMIDTLVKFEKQIEQSDILKKLNLQSKKYILSTLHRPATVDTQEGLLKLIEVFNSVNYKIIFPIHPRTTASLKKYGLYEQLIQNKNLIITEPLDYFAFQKLIKDSYFIITDSGGIQEESTFLQIPCLTLRNNTERPVTCDIGTNTLLEFNLESITNKIAEIENGQYKKGQIPNLWDGHATERIFQVISKQK